jgi:hypothetical protein
VKQVQPFDVRDESEKDICLGQFSVTISVTHIQQIPFSPAVWPFSTSLKRTPTVDRI